MRVYRRVIACVEGFLLACPLHAFGKAIDKYRLAYTLWIHKPTPIFSCHGHFTWTSAYGSKEATFPII